MLPRGERCPGLPHFSRRRAVRNPSAVWKFIYRFIGYSQPERFILERHFHFDPKILELPGDVYMFGDWQSAKYFEDIRDVLLKELTPKEPATGATADLLFAGIPWHCMSVGRIM